MIGLPKQITRTMHIVYDPAFYLADKDRLSIAEHDPSDLVESRRFSIGTVVVTVDVPQDVDITGQQVAILRQQKASIEVEAATRVRIIERKIQDLLALPAPAEEAQ